jgi:hypothetical protein
MLANAMWQIQQLLHGKSTAALPCTLVLLASILTVYCHATDHSGSDPTKTFLALIVVQMLPLVFLEMKILSCPDPVAMLSVFGTKVLLMHSMFLSLRVCAWPLLEVGMGLCNLVGLLAVCAALRFGFHFRFSVAALQEQLDIIGLVSLGFLAAIGTELLDFQAAHSLLERVIFTSSSYIEILSFVPAVWMVHQSAKKSDDIVSTRGANVQTQASCFFTFLVTFYVLEDVLSAFRIGGQDHLAALGHIVHFLLLLDFSCFLLAYIYNPERSHRQLLVWMPNQLWV